MLGQWRIVLKQAEESAKAGRFDEALALTNRSEVSDHRLALILRSRLALDLVARADRRASAEDAAGAIDDLRLAETAGAAPDLLAEGRLKLAERVSAEVKNDLDAGEPARVVDRVEYFARHKIGGPTLRRALEAAQAWRNASDEARRGEFGRAFECLDRAERLAGDSAKPAVDSTRREIETKQKTAQPKIDRFYSVLAEGQSTSILAAAEDVLAAVPEHPAARQARTRAWQQIGAISPTAAALPPRPAPWARETLGPDHSPIVETEPSIRFLDDQTNPTRRDQTNPRGYAPTAPTPRPLERRCPRCGGAMQIREGNRGSLLTCLNYPKCRGVASLQERPRNLAATLAAKSAVKQTLRIGAEPTAGSTAPTRQGRFLLWADAIGGYLVCPSDRVVLGRAGGGSRADVPLLGDLAPEHAVIIRDGDGYLIESRQRTSVNGKRIETSPLRHGDVIRLGSTVELEFRQPSPVSASACLSILSRHRLPLTVDGVILFSDTCVIGPPGRSHVSAPNIAEPIVLYRQGSELWFRAPGQFEVDAKPRTGRAQLGPRSVVHGEGFSFSVEPLDPAEPETTA